MRAYWNEVRSLDGNIHLFLYGEALFALAIGITSLLLNFHFIAVGLDENRIGTLIAVETGLIAALAIPAGFLADRVGRRRYLLAGTVRVGLAPFLITSPDFGVLIGARLLSAAGLTLVFTSEFPIVMRYCRNRSEETLVFSLTIAVFTMGIGAGNLIAGFLPGIADALAASGLPVGDTPYEASVWLAGILLCLVTVVRWRMDIVGPTASTHFRRWNMPRRRVLLFTGAAFLSGSIVGSVAPFLNLIVHAQFSAPTEWIGILFTVNGFCFALGSLAGPLIERRVGIRAAVLVAFALTGALVALLAAVPLFSAFAVVYWARAAMLAGGGNLLESRMFSVMPDGERSVYSGFRTIGTNLGGMLSGKLTGAVLAAGLLQWPFLTAAACSAGLIAYTVLLVFPEFESAGPDA